MAEDKCIVINVGSGSGTSLNDIIQTIENVTGKKLSVNHVKVTSTETGANIIDCSMAKEKFGWQAKHSLAEGIQIMLSTWNPRTEQFDERISDV